ncbi:cytochrome P450 4C1-like isoform X2 [Pectinophora gossypiella]|uniref:cytochrome P450 4C1-like isoform X2 n=1 Tax=Pectinophora gossypiella TaxID=13191 RepID=UPI00214E673A|nr:cytochrome P450 4C1-like isoform X2 [Pectinophora gossypiella]
MLVYLLLIVLFLCALDLLFKYNARHVRKIQTPKQDFFFGNGIELIKNPVELFNLARSYARQFNGIYGWYAMMMTTVNIYTPKDIEIVISGAKNTEKSDIYLLLNPWLREGLLLSKGAKWMHRRKILTPAFHFNILKKFLSVMEENSQRLVARLQKTQGDSVNVVPVLSDYTLGAICETAMGTRLDDDTTNAGQVYKNAVSQVARCCTLRMARIYYIPNLIFNFSSIGKIFWQNLETVFSFTKRIIKERREYVEKHGIDFSESLEDDDEVFVGSKKKKIAMLDLMISAEKDGVIDANGIQEEVDTFTFEGHDTTAAGLNYCLMLLANHKDIQDKIVAELNEVFGDSDREAKVEDLNALKYMDCCIKETLRLYPPVPFIGRTLSEDVVLSGYKVPAGTLCHIHIFDLHRREDLYKNPNKFDPDRFLPENSVGRHAYAYLPFSAGPRNCIGQRFATLELKSCVSALLRKFELLPVTTPEDLEFSADLVLRCTKPIYVKFVERSY